ncbi:energy-coupled thiamine transporter ThiT [Metabacillus sp. RGM 3146]|uniref:energy-coupled thiamine transporter ThiT n=1 Tax=Metabacillus sp. RGM 3146 TaxID=3401092 RepID=UPI003B9CD852
MNQRLVFLVETAIFAAIALLLDYVSNIFGRLPQGGSLSLAMIPIFIMAFRWGLKGGLLTGFLTGLLQIVLGLAVIVHWAQYLLDYPLAYALLGASGLFSRWVLRASGSRQKGAVILSVLAATFIGSLLRLASHVLSGIIFFASSTPKGTPVFLYSVVYNSSYMIPSWIVSSIVIIMVLISAPTLLNRKK